MLRIRAFFTASVVAGLAACQTQAFYPIPSSTPINQPLRQLSQSDIARYYPTAPGLQWHYALEQFQDGQDNTRFHSMTLTQEALPQGALNTEPVESVILRRRYPDSAQQPRPGLARRFEDRVLLSHYEATAASLNTSWSGLPLPHVVSNADRDTVPNATFMALQNTAFITALQAPLSPGQHWPGRTFQGGSETLTVKGEEQVHTPAGTFNALCIEHHLRYNNGREDFLRYWYAPNVGMVKMYEEITFYTDRWTQFQSTGTLTHFQEKH